MAHSKGYKIVVIVILVALVICVQLFFIEIGNVNKNNKGVSIKVTINIRQTTRAGNVYYISPDGNDTTGDGSYGNPWATLQRGISAMESGDTLIVKDGIYTGKNNTIYPWNYPPSGSPQEGYTTIRAEHVGKVIFDGEMNRTVVNINGNGMDPQPSYIQFEGIVFRNSPGEVFSIVYSNHIKVKKCGFYDAGTDNDSHSPFFVRYLDYLLVEDSYTWGNGKYKFFILDSNHVVLRRCIDRFDRGVSTSGYHSSFRIYSSNYVELQNCIAIDADPNHSLKLLDNGTMVPTDAHFVIWSGGVNGPNDNVSIRGTIVLNNSLKGGRAYILQYSYEPKNNTITNSVFWDIHNGLWSRVEIPGETVFDHLTVGDSPGGDGNGEGITGEYGYGAVVKNSIIYGIRAYGVKWTYGENNSSDYNVLYNNTHNYGSGATPAPHDYCLENGNEINPLNNSLKYLPRIEPGSDLSGKASDGGDIGATILYRIGRDGTLWGEPGWNQTTNIPLWPWPYEDTIKELMSQYYYDNSSDNLPPVRGDRGFCANGNGLYGGHITLTSYIWEYLGNPLPDYIYGNLTITTDNLPTGYLNHYYYANIEVVGGTKPYTWSIISGSLPDGLSLNSTTGEISGIPTVAGNYTFTVLVEDSSSPSKSDSMDYTMLIITEPIPEFGYPWWIGGLLAVVIFISFRKYAQKIEYHIKSMKKVK